MLSAVERLKVAVEEVIKVRIGAEVTWSETLDLDARTLAIGWVCDHDAQTLGRKLLNPEEVEWQREAEAAAREQGLAPMPYPKDMLKPLSEERIDFYRSEILRALLRQEAVNTKF